MRSKVFSGLFLFGSVTFLFGCGGGSNTATLCNAVAARAFEVCDVNDASDVEAIRSVYALFGEFPSDAEIQSGTQSGVASDCIEAFDGEEDASDELTEFALSAINSASSCQALASGLLQFL